MYDPKLWITIRERYWEGESPEEISSSLKGKPSPRAIWNKLKTEDWDSQKCREVQKFDEKSAEKFSDFLTDQEARYKRVLTKFDASIEKVDDKGRPLTFFPPKDLIPIHKDFRDLRAIKKAQEGSSILDLTQELLSDPDIAEALAKANEVIQRKKAGQNGAIQAPLESSP